MGKHTTIIKHPSMLNSLSTVSFFRTRGLGNLVLASDFVHPEKENLEKDLNKYYYACGCDTGATGLLIFLVAGIAYSTFAVTSSDMSIINGVLYTLGITVAGAVLGKMSGLVSANFKLKKTIHTIQDNWKPADKQKKEIILCG